MNYINKDFILLDLLNFSRALTAKYEVIAAPLFEVSVNGERANVGYFIFHEKRGRNYKVFDSFVANPDGTGYAKSTFNWTISHGEMSSCVGYERNLADIMEELHIKERKIPMT